MTATENQPFEETPNHELLTKLRSVYTEEGVSIWLAHAIRQGWSIEECLRRADILATGSFA